MLFGPVCPECTSSVGEEVDRSEGGDEIRVTLRCRNCGHRWELSL